MPTISEFFGILIHMYYNVHAPPHFHAKYGEYEALIQISPLCVLKGNLPPRALSLVIEWAQMHQEELMEIGIMLQITKDYKKFLHFNKRGDMEFKRARILECKPRPNYRVWIRFDDGLEGEVDLSDLVGKGVFEAWKSIDFFNQVRVDPKTETLTWGDEIDLDPYVLREKIINQ